MRTILSAVALAALFALAPACEKRKTVYVDAAPASSGSGGSSTGSPAPAPAPAPVPDVDTIGTLTVSGACRLLDTAGTDYELTGPLAAEIEDKVGASAHPVHVIGFSGPAAGCGAATVDVQSYSFTDGIYQTRSIAGGITWRTARFSGLFGANETVNVLEVDVTQPGVTVRPVNKEATNTTGHVTSRFGKNAGARAAVNGGFFDGQHDPVGFLKIGGQVVSFAGTTPRAAIGLLSSGLATIDRIGPNDAWVAVADGTGAGPSLVTQGRPDVTAAAEGMTSAAFLGRNPRTAVGVRATGEVVFATVDGRSAAGAGMTLDELARLMAIHGCERAMNLDGGGSTTMWIDGEPDDGVVNYPSDDGNADHFGERRVGNAFVIDAP